MNRLHAHADPPAPAWPEGRIPRGAARAGPAHLRLASRLCSGCALSADWVLETEDTLELRTKPKAASLAAGRREYPGGRSPDFGRLDFAAFEPEAFFKSAMINKNQTKKKKKSVDNKIENTRISA